MKFTEILEELKKGKKATREKWEECKTECYKYIKLEHGEIIAYLKDDNGEDKVEERTKCMFELADFTAEDWKVYQENPTQMWKPEFGEKYYYMTTNGNVGQDTFNTSFDKYRLSFRNVFKTAEEARKMVEKIKIINQLRELSNIDFYDCETKKYALYYSPRYKSVSIQEHNCVKELPFSVYFATKEDCQKAIDIIGEENLKKYYFDIED